MRKVESRLGRTLAEVLRELYVDQGMTLAEVGAEISRRAGLSTPVADSTVMRWMERLDIERRFPGARAEAVA